MKRKLKAVTELVACCALLALAWLSKDPWAAVSAWALVGLLFTIAVLENKTKP